MTDRFARHTAIGLSAILLAAFSIQYPLFTTFPMGGDAAYYSSIAKEAVIHPLAAIPLFIHSWYPLSLFTFSLFGGLPIDWPSRFVWWSAIGNIATGLSLGALAYRLQGWRSAAVAIATWALATTTLSDHFEDGTIAQLWSLAFMALFLESVLAGRSVIASVLLIITLLSHPITGCVLLVSVGIISLIFLPLIKLLPSTERRSQTIYICIITICVTGLIATLWKRREIAEQFFVASQTLSIHDYFTSSVASLLVLAPIGIYFVIRSLRPVTMIGKATLLTFIMTSSFLAFSDLIGINTWTHRFQPYFLSSLVILSALAFPPVISLALPSRALRLFSTLILFFSIGTATWNQSSKVYAYYESPSRYARLHLDERSSLEWLNANVNPGVIHATRANRHSEWIPVLTDQVLKTIPEQAEVPIEIEQGAHLIFFLKREQVPMYIQKDNARFTERFRNQSVIIYQSNE